VQLRSPAELARAHDIDLDFSQLTAVHPMASCPMSDDPLLGPVDSQGRHHSAQGLWIADGSLFPTSIGGPPQLSIYALGLHVGRAVVQAAGRFVDPAARVA
jgi:choline dehydrogenase-like flavoprotein